MEPIPNHEGLAPREARRRLLAAGGGVLFLAIVLATAVQSWWIEWPGRLGLSLGAVAATALAILLVRRRPWATLWLGVAALLLLLLVTAFFYGASGGGLRILGLYFDDVVAALYLIAVTLAVWRLLKLPALPWWGRWVVVGLGIHAAVPVAMGIWERIPFGEVLVGLWTLPYWLQGAYFGAAVLLPAALIVTLLGLWWQPLLSAFPNRRLALSLAGVLLTTGLVCAFEMNSRRLANALGFLPDLSSAPVLVAAGSPATPPQRESSPPRSTEEGTESAPAAVDPARGVGPAGGWQESFAWVRDEIGFEPTETPFRSPEGVLLNGRGSSLEQARLLAARLTADGERVRFVEGRLDSAQAATLLAETLPAADQHSYPAAVPISQPAQDTELAGLLERHFWIQLAREQEWLDLDPTFSGATPGVRFARPTATWNSLPAELLPSLALRLDLERSDAAGRPETLIAWEGAFEDLANAAVSLVVLARIETSSAGASEERGSGFDVFGGFGGATGEPEEGSQDRTTIYEVTLAVGSEVLARGEFRLAGGASDPMGPDAIERLDLRFEIGRKDGRRQESWRPLFEIGSQRERPPLFQRHSILLTANRTPESHFRQHLDAALAQRDAEAVREGLDRLQRQLREGRDFSELFQEAVSLEQSLGPASGHLLNLAFASLSDRLAAEMARQLSVFPYYAEPRILINTFQGSGEQLEVFFDLRRDSCAAISLPGQALLMREDFLYGRGVLESILEGKLIELLTGQRPLTTAELMTNAAAQGSSIVMYSQRERSRAAELALPRPARQRVLAALDRGKIVALPTEAVDHHGTQRWGWWEIEPTTREAVGVLDTGLHQATVQRTLIESEGVLDDDMAWAIGAITGATDTHWVLAALLLEHGELDKAALQEAKAYLKQIGEYLCSEIKVGKVWEEGVTVAEVKAEIEGCWEAAYSIGAGVDAGAEITILDKGWCDGFQKGFTCASMSILNAYLADV